MPDKAEEGSFSAAPLLGRLLSPARPPSPMQRSGAASVVQVFEIITAMITHHQGIESLPPPRDVEELGEGAAMKLGICGGEAHHTSRTCIPEGRLRVTSCKLHGAIVANLPGSGPTHARVIENVRSHARDWRYATARCRHSSGG